MELGKEEGDEEGYKEGVQGEGLRGPVVWREGGMVGSRGYMNSSFAHIPTYGCRLPYSADLSQNGVLIDQAAA